MNKKAARILVIDDEESVRDYVRSVLEKQGHTVYEAPDGKQGLKLLKQFKADAIITDLVMPEMEGIETIRAIRKDFPDCGIVAMSGSAFSGEYLSMAKLLGAFAVLQKPFSKAELLDCFNSL